jgi:hypothetical protein
VVKGKIRKVLYDLVLKDIKSKPKNIHTRRATVRAMAVRF